MSKKSLTAAQVRKLPWPKPLFSKLPLSTDDCYQIGQLIVERVQGANRVRVRARKEWSMRKLRQELGTSSAATFTRCVQVYEMARELGLKRPLQGIAASTLFLVSGLPKQSRGKVARKALGERWSKRRIEAQLATEPGVRRTGRPPGLGCIKALTRCSERPLTVDLDQVAKLDAAKRKVALKQVQQLISDVETLRQHLAKAAR